MEDATQHPQSSSQTAAISINKGGSGSRVSLACLPCRTRHVRCDAKKPQCDRCFAEGRECNYTKSRRGGLDRATLAARRSQAAVLAAGLAASRNGGQLSPVTGTSRPASDNNKSPGDVRPDEYPALPASDNGYFATSHISELTPVNSRLFTPPKDVWSTDSSTTSLFDAQSIDISRDPYIDIYYKCFHRYHPCVMPQRAMERRLQDTSKQTALKPLIYVMRLIGSIYITSTQPTTQPSTNTLEDLVSNTLADIPRDSSNYFIAQAHLLYSIALYWRGSPLKSRQHIDTAIEIALQSGMFRREFASDNGEGDPVLEECWRRTWWQIFIVDAYYAAIKRAGEFACFAVNATTELPCEEREYESGNIPIPRTLEEFNLREFETDNYVFSSFAYLIGCTHAMAIAMSRALSMAKGTTEFSSGTSPRVLESVDATIDGWMLLLPKSKRDIFSECGEVDELIFQALMSLDATIIGLHRPLSKCFIDPLEGISHCSAPSINMPPKEAAEFKLVHTAKCIRAAEAQIRLLALPTRPCGHSPFTVCMVTTGTLSLLSACKFFLKDQKLAVARDQIRMSIGFHKAMAAVWSQAASNLQEVQMIARHTLGIQTGSKAKYTPQLSRNNLNGEQQSPISDIDVNEAPSSDDCMMPSISLDNLQTFWNLGDSVQQMDLSPWWMCEPDIMP